MEQEKTGEKKVQRKAFKRVAVVAGVIGVAGVWQKRVKRIL